MANHINTQHFKKLLEAEHIALLKELATVGRVNPDNPDDWEATASKMDILSSDENELADKFESQGENEAILSELEPQLNDVKHALEKIEKGTYGVCEICQEPIETERLEANPAAKTCLKHMESHVA